MGQKVSPNGFRLGVNKNWDSVWFPANKKDIAECIVEDNNIRKHLTKNYAACSIAKVAIERKDAKVMINISTGRAGMLIGQKGAGIEKLKKELAKVCGNKVVEVNIKEVKNPDTDAVLVAQSVATQLEKRASWRRAMKMAIQRSMKAGVKGCKIMLGGRLDGADIARSEYYQEGILPLHTIRSDIDFGFAEAHTTFGVIGVKCWLCHGMILGKQRRETNIVRRERKPFKPNFDGNKKPFKKDFNKDGKKPFVKHDSKPAAAKAEVKEGGNA